MVLISHMQLPVPVIFSASGCRDVLSVAAKFTSHIPLWHQSISEAFCLRAAIAKLSTLTLTCVNDQAHSLASSPQELYWLAWIGLSSVLCPRQHSIGYMGDVYRWKDPTNSIKVL